MSNYKKAIDRIREVGINNARISPVPNSRKTKIEIKVNNNWVTVLRDLDQTIAEDVLRQATNKVILG
jgi:hypothetical protein